MLSGSACPQDTTPQPQPVIHSTAPFALSSLASPWSRDPVMGTRSPWSPRHPSRGPPEAGAVLADSPLPGSRALPPLCSPPSLPPLPCPGPAPRLPALQRWGAREG